jgi:glucose dehydrogenase
MKRVVAVLSAAIPFAGGLGATVYLLAQGAAPTRPAETCCVVPRADFPKVGGNYGNQNNSALAGINRGNIATLGGAWHLNLEGAAGGGAGGQQSSVVAVGGVLYVETTQGNVHAIDGKTGATKWVYKSGFGTQLRRGVAVGGGKVFTASAGKRVTALNQQTGAVLWTQPLGGEDGSRGSLKTAITYFDGLIYLGNADAAHGVAYALSAETGKEVWHFNGPAGPGEFGADTWEGDSYKTGGASPWMHPAIDP